MLVRFAQFENKLYIYRSRFDSHMLGHMTRIAAIIIFDFLLQGGRFIFIIPV